MTQSYENAKSRLNNITSIKPLLSALRTLSMGTWQMALNKLSKMHQFQEQFDQILAKILPKINENQLRRQPKNHKVLAEVDTILFIIGTERGLCGKFNKSLAENAITWIGSQKFPSYQIWALGSRIIREIERLGVELSWQKSLLTSDVASYQAAYQNTQNWLVQYESFNFNRVFIIYNELVNGQTSFTTYQLLPYEIQPLTQIEKADLSWPPPIIETDPMGIYHQIIEHYFASSFYQILLKSAIAEHSTRFSLMQESIDNADEIIEELQLIINAERKKQITQEMQELATGAGMID